MHQLAKLKPILLRAQFKFKWARTDYESQRWIAPRPTLPNRDFENNERNMIGTIGEHCRFQCIFDFSPILETRRPQKPVRLETSTWIQAQFQIWISPKLRSAGGWVMSRVWAITSQITWRNIGQLAKIKPILLRAQFKFKWARIDYESRRWIAPRPTLPNCSFENDDRNMRGPVNFKKCINSHS